MMSLRSMAASSAVRRSSSLGVCDGTSRACGWRCPTGARPIDRVSCVSRKGAGAAGYPTDDLGLSTVCAMPARSPSKASTATVLMKFRMTTSPNVDARCSQRDLNGPRCSRCRCHITSACCSGAKRPTDVINSRDGTFREPPPEWLQLATRRNSVTAHSANAHRRWRAFCTVVRPTPARSPISSMDRLQCPRRFTSNETMQRAARSPSV